MDLTYEREKTHDTDARELLRLSKRKNLSTLILDTGQEKEKFEDFPRNWGETLFEGYVERAMAALA